MAARAPSAGSIKSPYPSVMCLRKGSNRAVVLDYPILPPMRLLSSLLPAHIFALAALSWHKHSKQPSKAAAALENIPL